MLITNRCSQFVRVLEPHSFLWGLEAAKWDEPHADQIFFMVQEKYALEGITFRLFVQSKKVVLPCVCKQKENNRIKSLLRLNNIV